ncbi:MAG: hypothetical protein IPO39_14655 [Bacteroidetes bacterium]|nr:hypothetical protein [Bacteroidota bacterium]
MKNRQNIKEENEKLSGLMESLKDQHAFQVPENYFEELPASIQSQISQLPDFEKSAVVNPFSVPENYFEQLPLAISNAVEQSQHSGFNLRAILGVFLRPRVTLAFASFVIVVLISVRFFTREIIITVPGDQFTMEELNRAASFEDLDESDLMDLLANQSQDISSEDQNSGIEQYLIDNNIDITQLESKL